MGELGSFKRLTKIHGQQRPTSSPTQVYAAALLSPKNLTNQFLEPNSVNKNGFIRGKK